MAFWKKVFCSIGVESWERQVCGYVQRSRRPQAGDRGRGCPHCESSPGQPGAGRSCKAGSQHGLTLVPRAHSPAADAGRTHGILDAQCPRGLCLVHTSMALPRRTDTHPTLDPESHRGWFLPRLQKPHCLSPCTHTHTYTHTHTHTHHTR